MGSLSLQLQSSISFLCLGEYLYMRVGSAKIRSSKGKPSGAFFEFVKKFKKHVSPRTHIFFTIFRWNSTSLCFSSGIITNFINPIWPATVKLFPNVSAAKFPLFVNKKQLKRRKAKGNLLGFI